MFAQGVRSLDIHPNLWGLSAFGSWLMGVVVGTMEIYISIFFDFYAVSCICLRILIFWFSGLYVILIDFTHSLGQP